MSGIRAIVVDDEKSGRENLIGVLAKHCSDVQVLGEAASAIEAIDLIEKERPSLVFLDIEMPGGNGFEVLNHFNRPDFKVVFVTAYDHYAIDAIRFSALDYILKPIDILALKAALKRFTHQREKEDQRLEMFQRNKDLSHQDKRIAVSFSDKIDFVLVKEIISCRGEGGYTRIYLQDATELLSSRPLIDYEELLVDCRFIRTHKAHLINMDHVQSFVKRDGGYLEMSDGSIVPVARRKKEEVVQLLNK